MEYRPLHISLISADGLKDVNLFSKMDVYAEVSIAGYPQSKKLTRVDKNCGTNPKWKDARMEFMVDEPYLTKPGISLLFRLRAESSIGSDKDVGSATVPVHDLFAPDSAQDKTTHYQIHTPSGKPKGSLKFSYRFGDKFSHQHAPDPVPAKNLYAPDPVPAKNLYAPDPVPAKNLYAPDPVTAYPAAGSSAYPMQGGAYPGPGMGYPPAQAGYGYQGPPPPAGYGYQGPPPPAGYGYQGPPPPAGYGYQGPPQAGYGYQGPPPPAGYGYAPYGQPQKAKKNKMGMGGGLGMGLGAGLLGGLLVGEMIGEADAMDDMGGGGDFDF